jgi:uncharacterized membrane protein SpoIIM required for sporulation
MLEMIINPKRAERKSWEMLFIGIIYGSLSIILVNWIFAQDAVLAKYSGIFIITFCVMFSTPYMYYAIKLEEEKDTKIEGAFKLLKEHNKALLGFLFLFVGFIIAFSFFYIVWPSENNFKAQIETYCMINRPASFSECVGQYGLGDAAKTSGHVAKTTGFLTSKERLIAIFTNNIYVLMFTLIFSLIFGAGAIFVLAWNASVIAAAVGIFTKSNLASLPIGIARYMIHGLPEIAAYFIGALAGGIVSIAVIRHSIKSEKFWSVLQDSLNLIILAVIVLFVAALIEVFITPVLF